MDDVPLSFQRPAAAPPTPPPRRDGAETTSHSPQPPLRVSENPRPPTQAAVRREILNDVPLGFHRPAPYERRAYVVGRTVMLVGKARGKELLWSDMTVEQRKQFLLAMGKEWSKWTQFRATIPCPKKVLDKYPDDLKIIGTRWVMTYKSDGTPKARMVVQGCQENLRDVRGDAPTGSRDAMMLVIAFGSSKGWGLSQWDADSAYLQSEGLDRALLLRLPNPAPPGHQPGDIVVATGAIYGTKDAGRKWYLHLKKTLESFGIIECALEKGLYRMHKDGDVRMVIHTHVDDLLVAMEQSCSNARHTLEKLQKVLYLKGGTGQVFEYLARLITITADTISISQEKSAGNVEQVPIEKERRAEPESPLKPEEKSEFRSLLGVLSWLAQQTRIDIAVAVNKLAQRIEKSTIGDLMQANSVAKQVVKTKERCLVIRRNIFDPKNLALVGFGDASFASAEDMKSQAGEILLACKPVDIAKIQNGAYDKGVLLSYRTATVKRVVRSTLASEGYAVSEATDLLEWTRYVIAEITSPPGTELALVQEAAEKITSVVFTDSHGLADTVAKDTSANADRRFKLVVAMLRQTFGNEKLRLRWCNTLQMLADGLTKVLPYQCAICAMMASRAYIVPAGGKVGRLGAMVALIASRVGGSSVVVRSERPGVEDSGLTIFMVLMMLSYAVVFMLGLILAWMCMGRKSSDIREVLMVLPDRPARPATAETRTTPTGPTTARTRTAKVSEELLSACCQAGHEVRPGANAVSIYVTCSVCHHHATWMKNGGPTFTNFPALAFLKKSWDKLQEQSSASATVVETVSSVPKAKARPKRAARATDATPEPAPEPPEDVVETVTTTVTVRRAPPRAKRAAAKSTSAPAEAQPTEHGEEDYDDWSWNTPTTPQATTRSRAAATRRAPMTPMTPQPDVDDDL